MNLIPLSTCDRWPGQNKFVVLANKSLDLVVSLINFVGLPRAGSED